TWRQSIKGLGGRDVFTLYQDSNAPDTIYAGTNYGVYRSTNRGELWAYVGKPAKPAPAKPARGRRGARAAVDRGEHVSAVPAVAKTALDKKRPQKKAPAKTKKPEGPPVVILEEQVNAFARYVDAE